MDIFVTKSRLTVNDRVGPIKTARNYGVTPLSAVLISRRFRGRHIPDATELLPIS